MFESINRDGQQNATRGISSFLISLAIHAAILGVIVLVPLVFCSVLQPGESVIFLLDTPALPIPPAAPMPPAAGSARPKDFTIKSSIDYAPKGIPEEILRRTEEIPNDLGAPPSGWNQGMQDIGIAAQGVSDKSAVAEYLASLKATVLPAPKRPKSPDPILVVGSLQESKLIYKVSPVYPDLARKTRTSGPVIFEAIIDEEGNVSNLTVVSGHPLLVDAAREAVRQWRYSPTILSGEPVRVIARITVMFRIR